MNLNKLKPLKKRIIFDLIALRKISKSMFQNISKTFEVPFVKNSPKE